MSSIFNQVHENIRMGEGCVVIETDESEDVIEEVRRGVYALNKNADNPSDRVFVAFHDVVRGLQDIDGDILSNVVANDTQDEDLAAMGMTVEEPEACSAFDAVKMFLDISDERHRALENGDDEDPNNDIKQVLVLRNFDRELMPQQGNVNSRLLMAVQHLITVGRMTDVMLVLLVSTGAELPAEIREHVASVYHGLPENDERNSIIEDLVEATGIETSQDDVRNAVDATSGLSRAWTERSVSEALSRHRSLDTGTIWHQKASHLGRQGLLTLWTPQHQEDVKLWPTPESDFGGFSDVTMLAEETHQHNQEVPEGQVRVRLRYSDGELVKEHWADVMSQKWFEDNFRPERDFFSFRSVIGLDGLKAFIKHGNRAGIPDRAKMKGILLVGVPGTGKSFLMRCAAGELGMPLSEMSAANLYSKWVGETDKNLKRMLNTIEQIGGILGIDEYQRFMPSGGESEGRTSQSVAGGMLTWQNNQNSVFVLAAANDVSNIPPEFTRSGRFDTTFFVGFPSSKAKKSVWEMYMKRHDLGSQKIPKDEHWTPADISICCKMSEQQGVSLVEAAKFIKICYSGTGKKVLDDLMDWAENSGCLDAETGELFVHPRRRKAVKSGGKTAPPRTVRKVDK